MSKIKIILSLHTQKVEREGRWYLCRLQIGLENILFQRLEWTNVNNVYRTSVQLIYGVGD